MFLLLFGYFAMVGSDDIVKQVIVADQEFVDAHPVKGAKWVETDMEGKINKKYAGIGDTFDHSRGAFFEKKPFSSWKLNEQTVKWEPPVPMPSFKKIPPTWNEKEKRWDPDASEKTIVPVDRTR
jgi:hypothetical protein